MKGVRAVFRKEFRSYLQSSMGYIYLVVFLVLANWLFLRGFFIVNQLSFRSFFLLMPWLFLLFIPAITMRIWAEERKLGTIEILFTLPLKESQVLIGKFLASLAFLGISLLLTLPLPITGAFLGSPDVGQIVGGYLGALFLGAAYISIGTFASSLTDSQIVAFILGAIICFALFLVGENFVLVTLPPSIASVFRYLGLGSHFDSIARGVIDSRDVIYYLSVIWFFLYLSLRVVEDKR
ncbi:MAG TPA: ABC transporter [candidate division WOR-3 bacterium]|uniref:ABC transporter n=1 Tax=candidate division WOR-3 bacterium TaxID=2052148 RepID=A0A7C0XA50_UNCW3|nr:MAG: ABC transporter [Candidatus Hydrothermae bacterium]HDM89644.1 ABC transporter [candidate division WOR-3 bacterium]